MEAISEDLLANWSERQKSDQDLQASAKQRASLPIHAMKEQIMSAIHENPVVLIRGNTGCGKTTQVCQFILDDYISSGSGAFCNIICTQVGILGVCCSYQLPPLSLKNSVAFFSIIYLIIY